MPAEAVETTSTIQDPSDLSVSVALAALRRPAGVQVSSASWERVRTQLPHLRRFIEGASYQLAPDDPNARSSVSAALVSVVELLRNVVSQADVDEQCKVIFEGFTSDTAAVQSDLPVIKYIDPAA